MGSLVTEFARHLIERYGKNEVESWYFEVWNEPDLHMPLFGDFWRGSLEDYFRLFDCSAEALRSADPRLRVGGPAAATPGTMEAFLRHIVHAKQGMSQLPVDFFSFHLYSGPLINWQPLLKRYGMERVPVFYTEWGLSAQAGGVVNDLPYGAAWLTSALMEGNDNAEITSYWVSSDYSDETAPKRFFYGGFGLLGLNGVRKPRFWAFDLLHRMGHSRLYVDGAGDGFGTLVRCWATCASDNGIRVLLSNVVYDQTKAKGDAQLGRHVAITVAGLHAGSLFHVHHFRIDNNHTNVYAAWERMGKPDWPSGEQLNDLHRYDGLEMLEPERAVYSNAAGEIRLEFDLPMPAVSLLDIEPS